MKASRSLKFITVLTLFSSIINATSVSSGGKPDLPKSPYSLMKEVNLADVKWTKGLWADKFTLIHKVGIPNMWDLLNNPSIMHATQNFRIAAGLEDGAYVGTKWIDGDTYKWLEAVAYVYAVTKDEKLSLLMDEVIEKISSAQKPDGYIDTYMTIPRKERFQNTSDHELYNMGHLMTAACIHYRATDKKSLLAIALKAADCLYTKFTEPSAHYLGYSSIMGLVELYRTTGEKRYLVLADRFVSMQGTGDAAYRRTQFTDGRGTDVKQDRTPLRKEIQAVGHAVYGNYLYCGATDVYSETGDKELLSAMERIWQNVRYHKMYITGASTSVHNGLSPAGDKVGEAFGKEYELSNPHGYNETCSNIGSAMWNWRMLTVTGEARFADMAELILYNSALSSIGIDGKHFFYANRLQRVEGIIPPLKRDEPTRWTHQQGFCCPPNIVRTIAKLNTWAYSVSENCVWVNFYGGNKLETELPGGEKIQLTQETDYPWDGKVKIAILGPARKEYALMLRIPEWVENPSCKVNGRKIAAKLEPGKYFKLNRAWESGDVVELDLPMTAQLIEANFFVEQDRNQVAVKRGPLVYCMESSDLPDRVKVSNVMIPENIKLRPVYKEGVLGGVTVLQGNAYYKPEVAWQKQLYRPVQQAHLKSIKITLIPYFAWSNRGVSEMTVWMPVVRQ